jgi:predicted PurR-regulated permease PerM
MSDTPKSLILYAIWMTALSVVLLYAAFLVRNVLLLIYMSGLLAIGFSPTVRLIERQKLLPIGSKRFPRWLAILTLYVMIVGTAVGIGFLIVPPLIEQAQQLRSALPGMLARAQQFLSSLGINVSWQDAIEHAPGGERGDMVSRVLGALISVVGGGLGFLTILILTFYFLLDADQLRDSLVRLFPARRRPRVAAISRDITIKVSAWLGGQLLLGAIIGASSALALWLMDIPFFYVLALISAIGELIPVVGPILSAIPAIAVAATVSGQKALMVLIFFVVQQQLENHVLAPKIMERQVGISAVTVIVALLVGGQLLGIVGAILSVPTAAILMVVFHELTASQEGKSRPESRG